MTNINDPLHGQRALLSGQAVVTLPGIVVAVTGADALEFLESLTSQHLAQLVPGDSAESLLLDANGHVEAQLMCVRTDDGLLIWIPVPASDAQVTLDWLIKMRFRKQVEFTVTELAPIAALAAPAQAGLASVCDAIWHDPWPDVVAGGVSYAVTDQLRWTCTVGFVSPEAAARLVMEFDQAPLAAFDTLRISAARPMLRTEGDAKLLPHEVDWLRTAVHLEKGCYRGQETVAKVHNLGHPPRRLVLLDFDGSLGAVPARGELLRLAGTEREVGIVTVAGMHWEDGLIGLGLVKRNLDPDAALIVESSDGPIAATAIAVVSPDAGGAAMAKVRALRQARRR